MITDSLKNWSLYRGVGERMAAGLEYLASREIGTYQDGRYPILGDQLWLLVVTYETKPYEEAFFEGHEGMAEVHLVLEGEERVYWGPKSQMQRDPVTEEQRAKNKYNYTGVPAGNTILRGDQFACFLPEDIHMTKVLVQEPQTVRKAVLKVSLEP